MQLTIRINEEEDDLPVLRRFAVHLAKLPEDVAAQIHSRNDCANLGLRMGLRPGRTIVLADGGKIAAGLRVTPDPYGHLDEDGLTKQWVSLSTEPAYRGKGLAAALYALAQIVGEDRRLFARIADGNKPSRRVAERSGFCCSLRLDPDHPTDVCDWLYEWVAPNAEGFSRASDYGITKLGQLLTAGTLAFQR